MFSLISSVILSFTISKNFFLLILIAMYLFSIYISTSISSAARYDSNFTFISKINRGKSSLKYSRTYNSLLLPKSVAACRAWLYFCSPAHCFIRYHCSRSGSILPFIFLSWSKGAILYNSKIEDYPQFSLNTSRYFCRNSFSYKKQLLVL